MRRMFTIFIALAVLTPLNATAQERMSDQRYLAASECLAYGDLPSLSGDPVDLSGLRTAVGEGFRSQAIAGEARDQTRRVRARANGMARSESGLAELRERRDVACASFVERGLVQVGGSGAS
ncbi:MAG TPA: hypothetical protein VEA80_16135 [Vitreimonas sp.]|uniref:hypothetical protein n=1 Tax=Vitreimonas sp. TaxID=3069702 RepID=UPI002D572015|nr:hypothetical protein [Vitreimonas sp.]HYD89006.1 hypothetical protein [Vitreimonas sp.]